MGEILLFYPEQNALRLNSNEISIMVRNYFFKTVSQPTRNPEIKAEDVHAKRTARAAILPRPHSG
jgi:hypothetical protein